MKFVTKTILSVAILGIVSGPAFAQLNNRPFQFRNSVGGIGMSLGGKQAIMDQKLFGSTPDNLLRGADGGLLSVEEGRGKTAVVRYRGTGDIIPGYKGQSFGYGNEAMRVGVFNAYFTQDSGESSSYETSAASYSTGTVNAWTGRVAVDGTMMEHAYAGSGRDAIDAWTSQVPVLASN